MIRRCNYTGRTGISQRHVQITVHVEPSGPPRFDAVLDLRDYALASDARVFVEAYWRTAFMRFDFGCAGQPTAPPVEQRKLREFGIPDGLLFRVKVVESHAIAGGRPARLLAVADQIQPQIIEQGRARTASLLHIEPSDDMSDEVWKLEFGERGPVLRISRALVPYHRTLTDSPAFASLVMPEVFRAILTRILVINESWDALDEPTSWEARWVRLARTLPAIDAPLPDESDALDEWIDDAVRAFARTRDVAEKFRQAFPQETSA